MMGNPRKFFWEFCVNSPLGDCFWTESKSKNCMEIYKSEWKCYTRNLMPS